jgi:hypothetical protein
MYDGVGSHHSTDLYDGVGSHHSKWELFPHPVHLWILGQWKVVDIDVLLV